MVLFPAKITQTYVQFSKNFACLPCEQKTVKKWPLLTFFWKKSLEIGTLLGKEKVWKWQIFTKIKLLQGTKNLFRTMTNNSNYAWKRGYRVFAKIVQRLNSANDPYRIMRMSEQFLANTLMTTLHMGLH